MSQAESQTQRDPSWRRVLARTSRIRRRVVISHVALLCAVATSGVRASAEVVFAEDFENGNGQGWSMGNTPPDTADEGVWEIGDPVGTTESNEPAQPETAANGAGCAFTAQNPDGLLGADDVDGGVVWLISPTIDLSTAGTATLTYSRWYYLRDLNEDENDFFEVQVRESSTTGWVIVERLGDDQRHNAWTQVGFSLDALIPLTVTVQLRFGASDGLLDEFGFLINIVEAAIDDVEISAGGCVSDTDCGTSAYCNAQGSCAPYGNGDVDLDGDVDLADFRAFQGCFGLAAAGTCLPANLAGDLVIWHEDAVAIVARVGGPQ